jgi:tRNA threonylcarbamoyladenosine biosynthesis protein TsaE
MNREIITKSAEESEAFAKEFAAELAGGTVLLFSGDLGSGKTTFVRGLAAGFGIHASQVSSPSYTLVNEYYGDKMRLIHVDLYRLGDQQEVLELALEDLLDQETIIAIEWGERLPDGFPRHLSLELSIIGDQERKIIISKLA